jgi:hypothetical protein
MRWRRPSAGGISDASPHAFRHTFHASRQEGHKPGLEQIDRDQAKINLEIFARYLQRQYAFKAFFEREGQLSGSSVDGSKPSTG